jgi:hypothetical protein
MGVSGWMMKWELENIRNKLPGVCNVSKMPSPCVPRDNCEIPNETSVRIHGVPVRCRAQHVSITYRLARTSIREVCLFTTGLIVLTWSYPPLHAGKQDRIPWGLSSLTHKPGIFNQHYVKIYYDQSSTRTIKISVVHKLRAISTHHWTCILYLKGSSQVITIESHKYKSSAWIRHCNDGRRVYKSGNHGFHKWLIHLMRVLTKTYMLLLYIYNFLHFFNSHCVIINLYCFYHFNSFCQSVWTTLINAPKQRIITSLTAVLHANFWDPKCALPFDISMLWFM